MVCQYQKTPARCRPQVYTFAASATFSQAINPGQQQTSLT